MVHCQTCHTEWQRRLNLDHTSAKRNVGFTAQKLKPIVKWTLSNNIIL
jgi:hypothetical protein